MSEQLSKYLVQKLCSDGEQNNDAVKFSYLLQTHDRIDFSNDITPAEGHKIVSIVMMSADEALSLSNLKYWCWRFKYVSDKNNVVYNIHLNLNYPKLIERGWTDDDTKKRWQNQLMDIIRDAKKRINIVLDFSIWLSAKTTIPVSTAAKTIVNFNPAEVISADDAHLVAGNSAIKKMVSTRAERMKVLPFGPLRLFGVHKINAYIKEKYPDFKRENAIYLFVDQESRKGPGLSGVPTGLKFRQEVLDKYKDDVPTALLASLPEKLSNKTHAFAKLHWFEDDASEMAEALLNYFQDMTPEENAQGDAIKMLIDFAKCPSYQRQQFFATLEGVLEQSIATIAGWLNEDETENKYPHEPFLAVKGGALGGGDQSYSVMRNQLKESASKYSESDIGVDYTLKGVSGLSLTLLPDLMGRKSGEALSLMKSIAAKTKNKVEGERLSKAIKTSTYGVNKDYLFPRICLSLSDEVEATNKKLTAKVTIKYNDLPQNGLMTINANGSLGTSPVSVHKDKTESISVTAAVPTL